MSKLSMLDWAIMLAVKAHAGQLDKAGQPYILHPLAVMGMMDSEVGRIVAVLHDVVEDTDITMDDLQGEGFSFEIWEAIDAMTKRESETNKQYMERVKSNPVATKVKFADMSHNVSRLDKLPKEDERKYLTMKYQKQAEYLLKP